MVAGVFLTPLAVILTYFYFYKFLHYYHLHRTPPNQKCIIHTSRHNIGLFSNIYSSNLRWNNISDNFARRNNTFYELLFSHRRLLSAF